MQQIPVSEFKAHCLRLLEDLHEKGDEIVVTKRGRPFARVVPLDSSRKSARGILAGRLQILGEIVHVDWSREWKALR